MATPAITPTPTTDPNSVDGFLVIQIGAQTFTLAGQLRKPQTADIKRKLATINVSYKRDFADSVNLGTLATIAGSLADTLGLAQVDPSLANLSQTIKDQVGSIPVVGDLIDTVQLRITELTIDTATNPGMVEFHFGFGLDFSNTPNAKLGPVKLQAIGATIKVTKPNPAA